MTAIPLIIDRHPEQGANCPFPVADIVQAAALLLGAGWTVGYRNGVADSLVGGHLADTFVVGVDTESDLFVQALYASGQLCFLSNATPTDGVDALAARVADALRSLL